MNKIIIPFVVSSIRIAALPLFFILYNFGNIVACLGLLTFCAITDFLDGYIARKLQATSRFGAYYDASTDFILMLGAFSIFYANGLYPLWLIISIVVAFLAFILTSHLIKKIYDPVGRYLGSALYIGIALTLLWPSEATFIFVQYAFLVFFLLSLVSRLVSYAKR